MLGCLMSRLWAATGIMAAESVNAGQEARRLMWVGPPMRQDFLHGLTCRTPGMAIGQRAVSVFTPGR